VTFGGGISIWELCDKKLYSTKSGGRGNRWETDEVVVARLSPNKHTHFFRNKMTAITNATREKTGAVLNSLPRETQVGWWPAAMTVVAVGKMVAVPCPHSTAGSSPSTIPEHLSPAAAVGAVVDPF